MARYRRSKAGAIVASVVGTLVAAALVFCCWYWWEPISGFFKDIGLLFQIAGEKVEQEKQDQAKTQESGFIFDDESSFQEGIFLTSVRIEEDDYAAYDVVETAESAYTIEATIEPSNATQTALEWWVEFVDASSEWATGKTVTDYVTVSPYGDNGAVVSCLQPFGEQINVKVTLAENTALRASCTCDYAARVTEIFAVGGNVTDGSNIYARNCFNEEMGAKMKSNKSDWDYYFTDNITFLCHYSVGTIDVDKTQFEISIGIKFTNEFYNACYAKESLADKLIITTNYTGIKWACYSRNIFQDNVELTEEEMNDFISVMNFYQNGKIGEACFTLNYKGETVTKIVDVMAGNDWTIAATNVTLSDSNLTF